MAHKIFLFWFQRFVHRVCRRRCTQLKVKVEEIREEKRRKKWKKVWTVVRGGGRSSNPPTCKLCVGHWLWLIRYSDKGFFWNNFIEGICFQECRPQLRMLQVTATVSLKTDRIGWLVGTWEYTANDWRATVQGRQQTNELLKEKMTIKQNYWRRKDKLQAWTDNQLRELWQWRGWYIW